MLAGDNCHRHRHRRCTGSTAAPWATNASCAMLQSTLTRPPRPLARRSDTDRIRRHPISPVAISCSASGALVQALGQRLSRAPRRGPATSAYSTSRIRQNETTRGFGSPLTERRDRSGPVVVRPQARRRPPKGVHKAQSRAVAQPTVRESPSVWAGLAVESSCRAPTSLFRIRNERPTLRAASGSLFAPNNRTNADPMITQCHHDIPPVISPSPSLQQPTCTSMPDRRPVCRCTGSARISPADPSTSNSFRELVPLNRRHGLCFLINGTPGSPMSGRHEQDQCQGKGADEST